MFPWRCCVGLGGARGCGGGGVDDGFNGALPLQGLPLLLLLSLLEVQELALKLAVGSSDLGVEECMLRVGGHGGVCRARVNGARASARVLVRDGGARVDRAGEVHSLARQRSEGTRTARMCRFACRSISAPLARCFKTAFACLSHIEFARDTGPSSARPKRHEEKKARSLFPAGQGRNRRFHKSFGLCCPR